MKRIEELAILMPKIREKIKSSASEFYICKAGAFEELKKNMQDYEKLSQEYLHIKVDNGQKPEHGI